MWRHFIPVSKLARQAFSNLKANDPVRMAGATAFFTFFALPPIVIILSQVLSPLFTNDQQVSSQLFDKLAELFGPRSASQLEDISLHLQQSRPTPWLTLMSVVLLLLASTTLFTVIKNSLNQLWNIKAKPDRTFVHALLDKVIGLTIIVFSGVLVMISLFLNQTLSRMRSQWSLDSWAYYEHLVSFGHYLLAVLLLTVWFAVVFKYLPDVRIRWKAIWRGAFVTSVLFNIGQLLLDRLLIHSPVSSLYGASGAVILILLFVFYSALILYYGAAFTRQYAQDAHLDAQPNAHAVSYEITEVVPTDPLPDL